jgi:thiamine pyrophosphokinase
MSEISNSCRTLVLASGTLSPIQSLVAELDLTTPTEATKSVLFNNGLQLQPAPLEAEHIIDLQKQLLAVSIGHFPDGSVLTVKSANYNIQKWRGNLGNAICSVIESVPKGG